MLYLWQVAYLVTGDAHFPSIKLVELENRTTTSMMSFQRVYINFAVNDIEYIVY